VNGTLGPSTFPGVQRAGSPFRSFRSPGSREWVALSVPATLCAENRCQSLLSRAWRGVALQLHDVRSV